VPGSLLANHFGLEETMEGFGQGVVVAVAAGSDRGHGAGLGEALRVTDSQVLDAAVGVIDQTVKAGTASGPDC